MLIGARLAFMGGEGVGRLRSLGGENGSRPCMLGIQLMPECQMKQAVREGRHFSLGEKEAALGAEGLCV